MSQTLSFKRKTKIYNFINRNSIHVHNGESCVQIVWDFVLMYLKCEKVIGKFFTKHKYCANIGVIKEFCHPFPQPIKEVITPTRLEYYQRKNQLQHVAPQNWSPWYLKSNARIFFKLADVICQLMERFISHLHLALYIFLMIKQI